MELTTITAIIGAIVFLGFIGLFYLTRLRSSRLWTVTVTPLASIIGSGFLIAAPLMVDEYGMLAVPAMMVISAFAIAIGFVIRYNIQHEEDIRSYPFQNNIDRLSNVTISVAYVISVAFYTKLLSAFALRIINVQEELAIQIVSTIVLAFIAIVGWRWGLHGLEAMEKVAVNIKVSVIAALLVVLVVFVGVTAANDPLLFSGIETPALDMKSLQTLAGLLLIVQGFEITRFMGREYEAGIRTRALGLAQAIAAVIYVIFVALAGPLTKDVANIHSETAIIDTISVAAVGAGLFLSAAAIFSQFGAAVADTIGAGALIETESRGFVRERQSYPVMIGLAILLVWAFDVFAVLTLASRAFAAFYFLQAVVASITAWKPFPIYRDRLLRPKRALFPAMAAVLFLVALFAIPAEGGETSEHVAQQPAAVVAPLDETTAETEHNIILEE